MGSLLESFRKGRDAAFAERGFKTKRSSSNSSAELEGGTEDAGSSDTIRLLKDVSDLAEQLQKQVDEVEAERDDTKKLLSEVVAEGEERQKQIEAIEAERDEARQLITELTASIEELQKRITAVEAERDQLAEVLGFPGVRTVLHKATHTDTHPDADEEQRKALNDCYRKVAEAYALIARIKESREHAAKQK